MGLLIAALASLRPRQWVKNFFVFAGLIFSQNLFTPLFWPALAAFLIFCALSGAIYVFNDVADVEKDRLHPAKRYRPIARGSVPVPVALALGVTLLAGSLVAAFSLSLGFGLAAAASPKPGERANAAMRLPTTSAMPSPSAAGTGRAPRAMGR